MTKFGDIINQIEKENIIKVTLSEKEREFIDNHYKKLDELIIEANRLYGNSK